MVFDSILTCPNCGFQEKQDMPEAGSQFSYRCHQCKTVIEAKKECCCIYCSYGDYPCPKAQLIGSACCSPD